VHGGYDSQPVAGRVKRGLVLAAFVAAVAALGTTAGAGATSILVVDDDAAQCPNAGYADITTAIGAASPGDTILVCPGDYSGEGNIVVTQRLSLVGYTPRFASLSACADEAGHPATLTTKDSIVAGFQIGANFVSIRGFTVDHAPEAGVLIPGNISRATVSKNVLQHNSIGVTCIRSNSNGGSADGTGIYSDQGLKTSTIDQNLFFDNTSAAITLLDAAGLGSLAAVTVINNRSSQDGDLLSIAGATSSRITGNSSTGSAGSGIYLQAGLAANSDLVIDGNTLSNGLDEGIFADTASLTNSTLKNNTTKGNLTYGIHVSADNTANTVKNNNFKNGGGNNDCEDNSLGSGTGSTANTWTKDKGKTAFPAAICKK
jgi:nitrous oxidase accessory protein NosD